jgi:hypothetical protein
MGAYFAHLGAIQETLKSRIETARVSGSLPTSEFIEQHRVFSKDTCQLSNLTES